MPLFLTTRRDALLDDGEVLPVEKPPTVTHLAPDVMRSIAGVHGGAASLHAIGVQGPRRPAEPRGTGRRGEVSFPDGSAGWWQGVGDELGHFLGRAARSPWAGSAGDDEREYDGRRVTRDAVRHFESADLDEGAGLTPVADSGYFPRCVGAGCGRRGSRTVEQDVPQRAATLRGKRLTVDGTWAGSPRTTSTGSRSIPARPSETGTPRLGHPVPL